MSPNQPPTGRQDEETAEAPEAGDVSQSRGVPEREEASATDAAAEQVAALEDKVKRMQADFVNETRRIRQQAEAAGAYAIQRVLVDLLPLADALHRALAQDVAEGEEAKNAASLLEGIDALTRQFDETLKKHGVERIEASGQPFDPSKHEAVMTLDREDVPPQTVVEVVRPGFTLHGRVVRPAHVVVSRGR